MDSSTLLLLFVAGCACLAGACLSSARWLERNGADQIAWLFPVRGRSLQNVLVLALNFLFLGLVAVALFSLLRWLILWMVGR
jgi:hypothetical protein